MKNYNLTVIGCGNMAKAIISAVQSENTKNRLRELNADIKITVSDKDENKLSDIHGANVTTDNKSAVEKADYVFLAVKPQSAAEAINGLTLDNKIIVSIMAGVCIDKLHSMTGSGKIVRVMPNLNARIAQSYNAYACLGLDASEKEFIEILLSSFGICAEIPEEKLDAVTGLTGSSPAFIFMLIKSFVNKGVELGFDKNTAMSMALSTLTGSAYLVKADGNTDIDALIDSVCSKGGTTIEGVTFLRENRFEDIFAAAIDKAVERAKELNKSK